MKAIIPVAGAGTKLRPLTYTQPKPLIPVAGKPIIGFILDQLIEAGIDDFIFVLGYLSEKVQGYLQDSYPGIKKQYVVQHDRLGLGHAIYLCKGLISENEDALIQLGDTILDLDVRVFMRQRYNTLAVRKVNDPRGFGVVELDDDGLVKKLVEKPQIPKSNLAIVGLYLIKEWGKLMDCLEENIQKGLTTKGEFQLTDGMECMLHRGSKIEVMEVRNWFDCGKKEILLATNATLLARFSEKRKTHMDYEGSIIIPPVHIGPNCRISHSIIGPNVTIGDNSQVDNSILRDAIIGNFSILQDVVLQRSIIGNDAIIKGRYQSYNIGDNTEIDMV